MNDFMKDELLKIYTWGLDRVEAIGKDEFEQEGGTKVFMKIDGMIENYCDYDLQQYIHDKLSWIAESLPETVKQPTSFRCGYDTGYKQALLDLQRFLEVDDE
jgi:hypothetical protein